MNPRFEQILVDLKKAFGDLAGQDLAGVDAQAGFLDLGLDSLFLTQAAATLKSRFGVKVTFRQLNESLGSFASLAEFLAEKMPAAPVPKPAPAPVAKAAPAPVSMVTPSVAMPATAASGATPLERVMKEQLRVMEMQLAMLRGAAPAPLEVALEPAAPMIEAPPAPAKAEEAPIPSAPQAQHGPFRQLDRGQKGGLNDAQKAHLQKLTERYVAKTGKSKEYTTRYREHFADPRVVAGFKLNWKEIVYPIVTTRSAGAHLWDLDDNKWVDVTMGFGVALLGHSPAFITEAIKKQLDMGVEIGPQSPVAGEVAELICEFTGMERVTFCNTGSEAVMAALRVCRTVTGRTRIALFSGAYHGTFDEVLVKGALINGEPKTFPIAPGIAPGMVAEVTVLEYGTEKTLEWIRQNSADLAAVLVESVQSRHPDLRPVEFLREVRKITEATETPLIFDEVITGFRCHPGGAQALFGVQADIATYGKIVGGGMPFGFIAGKAWLMNAFDGGIWNYGDDSVPPAGVTFFAGTFVRHPLAMAAAKAILLHLKEKGPALHASLAERTGQMIHRLNDYFGRHHIPVHLENFTSVWYPHFGAETKWGSLLYYHLREKGLHIWEGRPCFLSTAHSEEDIAFIERAFKLSIAEMQANGFMDGSSDMEFGEEARRAFGGPEPRTPAGPGQVRLTEAQKELWVASQISNDASCAFNETCAIHLEGPFDLAAMQRAIHTVVNRHEALRSSFSSNGDLQLVAPEVKIDVGHFDLSQLPDDQKNSRVAELRDKEGVRVFDLARGPLIAFQILKIDETHHTILLTAHHIACDGWSYDIVLRELSLVYSALKAGKSANLPPAKPFRDYVAWEEERDRSEEGKADEAYWMDQFKTLPEPMELPVDRPRPAIRSFRGSREAHLLKREVFEAVKKTNAQQKVTLFSLLLASCKVLLCRLSGQDDVVVSVPADGQNLIGSDTLVGHCANLLLLRTRAEITQPFPKFLQTVKGRVLDAYEHQSLTFGSLLKKLNPPRDASRTPLAPVFFNFDPSLSDIVFADLKHHIDLNPRHCYQFDIGFNVVEEDGTLRIECDYNTDLFDATTIQRWLRHYEAVLTEIGSDPTRPIELLALLSETDREQIVSEWNQTDQDYPRRKTLHELIADQAARTPKAVAVECEGEQMTYAELDQRAGQLGNYLQGLGVGPNVLVGVCVERSIDMLVGLLATLKAGGAYVPLDPDFPPDRIAMMLQDAKAPVVITQSPLLPRVPDIGCQLLCLDKDWDEIRKRNSEVRTTSAPEDLAYVIYTSGSTGKPKGVEIQHGAVVNFMLSMQREPGLKAEDVMLALTTLSFDIAGLELFLPLTVGARVRILPRRVVMDPHKLMQEIAAGVTTMQATPATWRMLLDAGWKGEPGLKILCGGEAITRDLADRLIERAGVVWNVYGPTETTIWSTVRKLEKGDPITIGRPIANTQLYIVDEKLAPMPIGVPGELLIGGDGVARGYRNQPDLTAKKFIANPFRAGGRVYRTGDLARYLANGEVEFLGRSDFQVKIRGYRIELGDIETALLSHPKIREAAVVARKDSGPEARLVAYFAGRGNGELSSREFMVELREFIRGRLPDYMMPSAYVSLSSLPKTLNNKIDRRSLPAPPSEQQEMVETYKAPRTAVEKKLAELWADALRRERVGIRDNFFEIGGHSLLAVRLFVKIEEALGVRLPLATLFRAPTIEQLAVEIPATPPADAGLSAKGWSCLVPIETRGDRLPFFCVHGAGGNVLLYRELTQRVAGIGPFYGLQAQGLDGKTALLTSIEEMATLYLKAIREVQPRGPYQIGGYCMGGTVAYEMAQQLKAAGEEVALVALLDTYNFSRALEITKGSLVRQKVGFHLKNIAKLGFGDMVKYVGEKMRIAMDGELANLFSRGEGSSKKSQNGHDEGLEASLTAVNEAAASTYLPKPYAGKVTLFKPKANYDFYPDPQMGWGDLVQGGLELVELSANPHAMLVEPFVARLGEELVKRWQGGSASARSVKPAETLREPTVAVK